MAERNVDLHEFDNNPVAFARDFVSTLSAQLIITVPLSSPTRPLPLPQAPKCVKRQRCSWGKCNNDTSYLHRLPPDCKFIPFPKPKLNLDKCMRWIKQCGRPHNKFSVSSIKRGTFICTQVSLTHSTSKHWFFLIYRLTLSPTMALHDLLCRLSVCLHLHIMHGKFLYEQ